MSRSILRCHSFGAIEFQKTRKETGQKWMITEAIEAAGQQEATAGEMNITKPTKG
jgi:hypothetical protein